MAQGVDRAALGIHQVLSGGKKGVYLCNQGLGVRCGRFFPGAVGALKRILQAGRGLLGKARAAYPKERGRMDEVQSPRAS